MRVVRRVLVAVSLSDNFFYTPIVFLFQVGLDASGYGLEHGWVVCGYGGAYLYGGCACEEEFYGVLPCGYSAASYYGRFYLFVDVVDCAEGDGFYGWS